METTILVLNLVLGTVVSFAILIGLFLAYRKADTNDKKISMILPTVLILGVLVVWEACGLGSSFLNLFKYLVQNNEILVEVASIVYILIPVAFVFVPFRDLFRSLKTPTTEEVVATENPTTQD